ncbi:MAG: hypothetical protein AAF940_00925, partial [Pseudomonadota bacterium]
NDADDDVDVATINSAGNNITALLGTGIGNFGAQLPTSVGMAPLDAVSVDLDLDGIFDLAVASSTDNTVYIMTGDGRVMARRCG